MDNDLIQNIKEMSHKAAEDYLLFKKNPNDTITEMCVSGQIENNEILKRVCEHANQNIYLGLFNDSDIDKSNIAFPYADFDTLKTTVQQSEQAMKIYNSPPEEKPVISIELKTAEKKASDVATDDYVLLGYRDTLIKFAQRIEALQQSEIQSAEASFDKMAHDTKLMIFNGESIGDIAKLATRNVQDHGLDGIKIASAYNEICSDLVQSGFHVKTEFTKLSSCKINNESEMLLPSMQYAMAIEKAAAFKDVLDGAKRAIIRLNKVLMS